MSYNQSEHNDPASKRDSFLTGVKVNDAFRAGYVAIVGEPNVGKSTLMNALIGQKLSIVTRKPQTTRHKILGILSREHYQIIILDTPGIVEPEYLLHEVMVKSARTAVEDADLILLMIDVTQARTGGDWDRSIVFRFLKGIDKPVILLINKIDRVKKEELLPVIASFSESFPFKEIVPISALTLIGIEDLIHTIVQYLPEHPPYYPPDQMSDLPERFFVAEIIREKIFEKYRQEIPYSTTVDIVEFREEPGKKDVVRAEIIVERESQKGILIGKQGAALKEIGKLAREEFESFLGRPVFLELHVKVRPKWRESVAWLNRLGYHA